MYGRPVLVALERLWEIFDRPCGQRLKFLVEGELERLRSLGELKVDEKTARKTEWIAQRRYGQVGGNLIAKKIPQKMTDWDLGQVGFLEMDLVHFSLIILGLLDYPKEYNEHPASLRSDRCPV